MPALTTDPFEIAQMDARRLGHCMTSWSFLDDEQRFHSWCRACQMHMNAPASKQFAKEVFTGPALSLRCKD